MEPLSVVAASDTDANALAALRVAAMRPSLEAVGRFDPERARSRFLNRFDHHLTWKLLVEDQLIGFYVVQCKPEYLWLDHLYVHPDWQGQGIASQILPRLKAQAVQQSGGVIRLMALKGSPANDFYLRHGFVIIEEQPLDNIYQWRA